LEAAGLVRVLGVEDGSFPSWPAGVKKGKALLAAVTLRDFTVEDVALAWVAVDGWDATEAVIQMVKQGGKKPDLVMLASLAYAGFNLVDPEEVHRRLRLPVLIVNPQKPDSLAVEAALKKHFPNWKQRLAILDKAKKPYKLSLEEGGEVFFYTYGLRAFEARKLIKKLTVFGHRPEPLRVARLIARGLSPSRRAKHPRKIHHGQG
jgi:hypothetical protein